jgi:uncharacterized Tic20 family protein
MGAQKNAYKRADGSIVYYSDSDISLESNKKPKEPKEQSLLSKIMAILFLLFQSLMLILGIAILAIGIVIWKGLREKKLDVDPALKSLPMYLIGGGIAIIVISLIAISAAASRKRTLGFFYIVVVMFLVGAQIYALIQLKKVEGSAREYFSRKWDALQPESRFGIQMWRGCCGFDGQSDRSQGFCAENVTTGCWLQVKPKVQQLQDALTKVLYGSIATHIALMIIMLIILLL